MGCGVSGEYFLLLLDLTQSSRMHYKMQSIISYQPSANDEYCIMRECENILCGYVYDGDLVFVILKGIYGLKFPKRFLEISSRDLTSSFLFCQF